MSRALDRYLVTVLGVVAVAAFILARPQRPPEPTSADWMPGLPVAIAQWHGVDGVPESMLPVDSRALRTVRRTYTDGQETVWLALARYPGSNDPRTRPSGARIAERRGASSSERGLLTLSPNGNPNRRTSVNTVAVHHADKRVYVLYWHALGGRVISNDYELRLRLFANTLRGESEPLFLIRLASENPEAARRLLGAIRHTVPGRP